MGQRFLITVGQPNCAGFNYKPLPRVASDVTRIGRFFTDPSQNYDWVLKDELADSAPADSIRRHLGAWFSDPERCVEDCVVLYWAGHGVRDAMFAEHALLTVDSHPEQAHSMINTQDLMRLICGNPRFPRSVLLILDVCLAAQGGGEMIARLQNVQTHFRNGAGLWLLCTSDANTSAYDGAFVSGFLEMMDDLSWAPKSGARFVTPHDVSCGVNDIFRKQSLPQEVVYNVVQGGRHDPPFLRNPRFDGTHGSRVLEDEAYWRLKASGADGSGYPGWFFTGRRRALNALLDWLDAADSKGRIKIVTAAPGSGKSSVLALLTVAADATATPSVKDAAVRSLGRSVTRSLYSLQARGMRAQDLLNTLGWAVNVDNGTRAAIEEELAKHVGIVGIVVDSLDESAEPHRIERDLLRPLAAHSNVRLILGTRRTGQRVPLHDIADVIDLDDPDYFRTEDVTDYALARLTSVELGSPYALPEQRATAEKLAREIAIAANRSFLYARVVSRWALSANRPDSGRPAQLPRSLSEAFEQDLGRFHDAEGIRVRDLLRPLAYARGRGLPHKTIWAAAASKMAGTSYDGADIGWLILNAAYFLIQDVERGETVYRLYHESFAEHLRRDRDSGSDHRAIASGLLETLPVAPAGVSPWAVVDEPYIRHQFPGHASQGRLLGELLDDPEFLLSVSPDALTPELLGRHGEFPARTMRIYRKASLKIRDNPRAAAAAHLALAALQERDPHIYEALARYRDQSDWWPVWCDWEPEITGFGIGRAPGHITSILGFNDSRGAAWAICGYPGGVALCKLPSGEMLFDRRLRSLEQVKWLAVAQSPSGPVFIAATTDGIWVLDSTGRILGKTSLSGIQALTYCASLDMVAVALAEDESSSAIELRSLPDLTLLRRRAGATRVGICTLATIEFGGKPALATGTDSFFNGQRLESHTFRIWSLPELESLYASDPRDIATVGGLARLTLWDRRFLAISGIAGSTTCLWDIDREKFWKVSEYRDSLCSINRVLASVEDGTRATLIGEEYGSLVTVAVSMDEATGDVMPDGAAARLHRPSENFLFSEACRIEGRSTLVAAVEQDLFLIDVEELLLVHDHDGIERFSSGESFDVSVLVSDSERTLIGTRSGALSLRTSDGRLLWNAKIQSHAVGAHFLDDEDIFIVTDDGHVHRLNSATGLPSRATTAIANEANCSHAFRWRDQMWCAIAVKAKLAGWREASEKAWQVQIWNLETGARLAREDHLSQSDPVAFHGNDPEKPIHAACCQHVGGQCIVAFAGPYGEVTLVNLDDLDEPRVTWQAGAPVEYIRTLATVVLDERVVLYAGGDSGGIYERNLGTGESSPPGLGRGGEELLIFRPRGPLRRPRGPLRSLCVLARTMEGKLASGAAGGTIEVATTLERDRLFTVDVGRPVLALAKQSESRLVAGTDRGVVSIEISGDLRAPKPESKTITVLFESKFRTWADFFERFRKEYGEDPD